MFDWLFSRSKKDDSDPSRPDPSRPQTDKTTRFATREEALAAAKKEIDLLVKKAESNNGCK